MFLLFSVWGFLVASFSVEFSQEMGSHAQLVAFKALIQAAAPQAASHSSSKFVKKMDEIPSLELSPSDPCQKALLLSEQALIGKFTGLWPSPKVVELWIVEHWNLYFARIILSLCSW